MFGFLKNNKKVVYGLILLVILFSTISARDFSNPTKVSAQVVGPPPTQGVVNQPPANPPTAGPSLSPNTGTPSEEPGFWDKLAKPIVNALEKILLFLPNAFLAQVGTVLLALTSFVLWLSAGLFEFILTISVVNAHEFIETPGIQVVWKTFRDLANMFFIFILLYAAIGTILGLGGVDIKKTITRVVIVALLINFSFFFTKVAVDASNILTIAIYNDIKESKCSFNVVGLGEKTVKGISGLVMCKIGLSSILSGKILNDIAGGAAGGTNIMTQTIIGSIVILILAIVFFSATLIFLVRMISLIFLFIFSPLAFAATAMPGDKYSSEWFHRLASNCLVAPAFMLCLWAAFTILNELKFVPSGITFIEAISGNAGKAAEGSIELMMNYAITIGMIIASLIVAKSFGTKGADAAMKVAGWAGKHIGRAVAYYPQQGLHRLDEKIGEQRWAHTALGSVVRAGTTEALAGLSIGGKTAYETHEEADKLRQHRTIIDDETKAHHLAEAAHKFTESTEKELADQEEKLLKLEEYRKEHWGDEGKQRLINTQMEKVKESIKKIREDREAVDGKAQDAMAKLSPKSFVDHVAKELFFDPNFMKHASITQFLELMKGDRLTEDEKKVAAKARNQYIEEATKAYDKAAKDFKEEYGKWEIENYEYKLALEAWEKGDKDPATEPKKIRPAPTPPRLSVRDDIRGKNAKEMEMINIYNPELMENQTFMETVRFSTHKEMRASEAYSQNRKDRNREMKFNAIIKAREAYRDAKKALKEKDTHENRRAWALARQRLQKSMSGQAANELASMPGSKAWKTDEVLEFTDRGVIATPEFAGKDIVDKKIVHDWIVKAWDRSKPGAKDYAPMTEQNKTVLDYMLNDRVGKNFYVSDELARIKKEWDAKQKDGGGQEDQNESRSSIGDDEGTVDMGYNDD